MKPTISSAIDRFLDSIKLSRSAHTARSYKIGLNKLVEALEVHDIDAGASSVENLPEDAITWLASSLRYHAPTTERLYLTAAVRFFEFLAAENLVPINLPRVRLLVHQRARRIGIRLPQFPRDTIEVILAYAQNLGEISAHEGNDKLINLRDRAFLITLADTGLRVHEACKLLRGDIDWNEGRAIIIGKGDKESVVRFSPRSMAALKDYLGARAKLDGASGKPLRSLPLFARHDKGAGKKVLPITTTTGRNIVAERVAQVLGEEHKGEVTPHSFRHYFVTTVLRASGNLKMAQELARHSNITTTQRYAHLSDEELDRGYWEIFKET